MSAALLFSVPLLPLLLALAVLQRPGLARWSALGLLPAGVALLGLDIGSDAEYAWWLLGSEMGLDRVAYVFLCFTLVLWLAAALFANSELEDSGRTRFSICFLLTMGGNLGVILAQDAATFYFYFALMSFASYGLVIQRGDRRARRAGAIYLSGIVIGEVMLFAAFVMLDAQAGDIGFDVLQQSPISATALVLLLIGFGIKSGLLLLHVWMPPAYAAAPVAATVVLAGAMVNLGLLGWLRFLPLGWALEPTWGRSLMVMGFMAAFYGVVAGLLQRNPKAILAYSSVSQMGLMTALIGLGLMAPQYWPVLVTVVLIYAAHHALVKGALFMGLGVLGGTVGTQRRWLLAGFVLVVLAMAGAPLLSGAVAKSVYKAGSKEVLDLSLLLSLSATATALLMARLLDCLRYLPRAPRPAGVAPWYLLLGVLLAWPWLWPATRHVMLDNLTPAHWVSALWPILAAAGGYAAFMLLRRFVTHGMDITLPPGDLLLVYEATLRWTAARLREWLGRVTAWSDDMSVALHASARRMRRWLHVGAFEGLLLRWEVAWGIYLGLLVVLGLIGALN